MTLLPYRYPNLHLYVSPAGNDVTGNGSLAHPWATPYHALAQIRAQFLQDVLFNDITVNILTGTYAISPATKLAMTNVDNPHNGHRIIWRSVDGPGLAILDGSIAVSGWVNYSGNIYRAAIADTNNFWTLSENNIRSDMARTPARIIGAFPSAFSPYYRSTDKALGQTDANNQTLGYDPLDFNPATWTLADLQARAWSGGFWQWSLDQALITSRDTVGHKFGLTTLMKFNLWNALGSTIEGSRYFIQGDLSMLTGPGQWYYDRNDTHGSPGAGFHYLYYWARDGAIASQDIRIPTVDEIISLTGASQYTRMSGFTFDGFAIKGTDFVQTYRWGYSYNGTTQEHVPDALHIDQDQSYFITNTNVRTGAIHAKHIDSVTFENMHISNVGVHGLYAEGYVQGCTFANNWIEKTGHTGLFLEGFWPGEGDVNNTNTIFNHRINNVGELAGDATGLDLFQSGSNTVSHLDIHDGPRRALWIHGGYNDTSEQVYARLNTFSYAKVARMMQDSGDAGALGISFTAHLGVRTNTNTLSQCTVDDINADPSMDDISPNGVMCDDQANFQIFENIQVTNTTGAQWRCNSTPGTMTYTNTSFLSNGNPNPAFNPALMDTANIGTTNAFPY